MWYGWDILGKNNGAVVMGRTRRGGIMHLRQRQRLIDLINQSAKSAEPFLARGALSFNLQQSIFLVSVLRTELYTLYPLNAKRPNI
jgi:hypothetical protein